MLIKYRRHVQPLLDALLPASETAAVTMRGTNRIQHLKSLQVKLLVYACVNGIFSIQEMIEPVVMYDFLQPLLSPYLQKRSLALPQPYDSINTQSLISMAENLFLWAIEKGDCDTVKKTLSLPEARINVNKPRLWQCSYATPVERSARHGHTDLTELLIKDFQADVNASHDDSYYGIFVSCQCGQGGALEAALFESKLSDFAKKELLAVIANAGGTICAQKMKTAMEVPRHARLLPPLSQLARPKCMSWISAGIYHEAVFRTDEASVIRIVDAAFAAGTDLETTFSCEISESIREREHRWTHDPRASISASDIYMINEMKIPRRANTTPYEESVFMSPPFPTKIIDIAIERGHLSAVKRLRQVGVSLTENSSTAAVRSRSLPMLNYVLKKGAAVDSISRHYRSTALAEAIRLQMVDVVDMLLHRVQLQNYITSEHHYCAMLAAAAEAEDWPWVQYLLTLEQWKSAAVLGYALVRAIMSNRTGISLKLLEMGASIDSRLIKNVLGFSDRSLPYYGSETDENLPLLFALSHHNAHFVLTLLEHGPRTQKDDDSFGHFRSIFVCAVLLGCDIHLMQGLLDVGFDPNSGLVAASLMGHLTLVRFFLRSKILIHQDILREALCGAIGNSHVTVARELVAQGGTLPRRGGFLARRGLPPLCTDLMLDLVHTSINQAPNDEHLLATFRLCIHGGFHAATQQIIEQSHLRPLCQYLLEGAMELYAPLDLISSLFDAGADPNGIWRSFHSARNPGTAFLCAIDGGDSEMVKLFILRGACINEPTRPGVTRTPLQKAAEQGSKAIVQLLLSHGADVHAIPAVRNGGTPIQLAARGGYIGIVELLVAHDEDICAPGSLVGGYTALEAAARNGRFDMVVYLTRDPMKHPTSQYRSAISLARARGHNAIATLLTETMEEVELVLGETFDPEEEERANIRDQEIALANLMADIQARVSALSIGERAHAQPGYSLALMPDDEHAENGDASGNQTDTWPTNDDRIVEVEDGNDDLDARDTGNSLAVEAWNLEDVPVATTLVTETTSFEAQMANHSAILPPTASSSFNVNDRHQTEAFSQPDSTSDANAAEPPGDAEPEHSSDGRAKKFVCSLPECFFSTDRNDTLKRHIATHQTSRQKRVHKCQHCPSAFSRSDSLKNHLKVCAQKPTGISKPSSGSSSRR